MPPAVRQHRPQRRQLEYAIVGNAIGTSARNWTAWRSCCDKSSDFADARQELHLNIRLYGFLPGLKIATHYKVVVNMRFTGTHTVVEASCSRHDEDPLPQCRAWDQYDPVRADSCTVSLEVESSDQRPDERRARCRLSGSCHGTELKLRCRSN